MSVTLGFILRMCSVLKCIQHYNKRRITSCCFKIIRKSSIMILMFYFLYLCSASAFSLPLVSCYCFYKLNSSTIIYLHLISEFAAVTVSSLTHSLTKGAGMHINYKFRCICQQFSSINIPPLLF